MLSEYDVEFEIGDHLSNLKLKLSENIIYFDESRAARLFLTTHYPLFW